MNKTLSIYFSRQRTYLTVVTNEDNMLSLEYVNATKQPVNPTISADEKSQDSINELHNIFITLPQGITQLFLVLPAEDVYVSQFPGRENQPVEEMKQLVELEKRISSPYPEYEIHSATAYPMEAKLKGNRMVLSVMVSQECYENCLDIIHPLEMPITGIELSQISTHNAFYNNYPELSNRTIIRLS